MSVETIQPWLAHRPRRGATRVDMIVLHATAHLNVTDAVEELKVLGQSYHYIIDRLGATHKCVPYSAVAFHAGNSYGPHEVDRGISREQDVHSHFVELTTVNEYSIGISLLNDNDGLEFYPNEQLNACVSLMKELVTQVPSLKYLTTHYYVSPGRVSDPVGLDIEKIARQTGLNLWKPS